MSEFKIEVVKIGKVEEHPNADRLEITYVHGGYPCLIGKGELKEGDLAVYIPVDSVVPSDDPRFAFLDGHWRIKARKLRGIFSMGLIIPAEPGWEEGQDVREALRIEKYEPPLPSALKSGDCEADPGYMIYYDIEGLRRYPDVLIPGEEVVITEKLHGTNARYLDRDDRLWCAEHRMYKKESDSDSWWRVARQYNLAEELKKIPNIGVYGEIFGLVQKGYPYGADVENPLALRMFEALDTIERKWLCWDEVERISDLIGVPTVPVLYRGPWAPELVELAEGPSTMPGAENIREGIVIRPVEHRFDPRVGRVIFKLHGEGYLLGKKAKRERKRHEEP